MTGVVERDPMPAKLAEAFAEFEARLAALSYVDNVDVLYQNGRLQIARWQDPDGHHFAFQDSEGWYRYARVD